MMEARHIPGEVHHLGGKFILSGEDSNDRVVSPSGDIRLDNINMGYIQPALVCHLHKQQPPTVCQPGAKPRK